MKWKDVVEYIPGYGIWFEIFRRKPTEFEIFCKLLGRIRKMMKKGVSNNDIRNWLITTHQPIDRIWTRDEPTRKITIAYEDEFGIYFFGYVIERNGKFIDLIPSLNQM